MKYNYLIVGAGLYGAVFAHEAMKEGKTCLVIDKRDHIAGNIYCEEIEGINVHKYLNEYSCAGGLFRIFWYKVWILSLIPDKINIIKMKEGILKCPQILHLIYNDFIQMSLK